MKSIFWDTNLFIYLLEDSPQFGQAVADLRRRMLRRNDRLFTSAMTVGEVLVKPLGSGHAALADRYRTHVEIPCARPEDFPVLATPRTVPRPRCISYGR